MDHFLDLRDGSRTDRPLQVPLETVSYNLSGLYLFHSRRVRDRALKSRREECQK